MIWLGGVLALGAVVVGATVRVGWQKPPPPRPLWDIARLSATFTGVVGPLAGFSVASAVFLASLSAARATNGDLEAHRAAVQADAYMLSVINFVLRVTVAWLALRPLLLGLELTRVADVFTRLLLVAIVGAAARTAMALHRSHGTDWRATVAMLGLGFGGPVAYRLASLTVAPALWPTENAAFDFAIAAFLIGGCAFFTQTGLFRLYGDLRLDRWLVVNHRVVLALGTAAVLDAMLLWLAIAAGA